MLSRLYIENIAVIEAAEIDFSEGFSVLSGETGAGKSIIIDSLNAVFGARVRRGLVSRRCSVPFLRVRRTHWRALASRVTTGCSCFGARCMRTEKTYAVSTES